MTWKRPSISVSSSPPSAAKRETRDQVTAGMGGDAVEIGDDRRLVEDGEVLDLATVGVDPAVGDDRRGSRRSSARQCLTSARNFRRCSASSRSRARRSTINPSRWALRRLRTNMARLPLAGRAMMSRAWGRGVSRRCPETAKRASVVSDGSRAIRAADTASNGSDPRCRARRRQILPFLSGAWHRAETIETRNPCPDIKRKTAPPDVCCSPLAAISTGRRETGTPGARAAARNPDRVRRHAGRTVPGKWRGNSDASIRFRRGALRWCLRACAPRPADPHVAVAGIGGRGPLPRPRVRSSSPSPARSRRPTPPAVPSSTVAMLEALGIETLTTSTSWTDGPQDFEGVRASQAPRRRSERTAPRSTPSRSTTMSPRSRSTRSRTTRCSSRSARTA